MEYVEGMEKYIQILVGKPEEKKTLDITEITWENYIKICVRTRFLWLKTWTTVGLLVNKVTHIGEYLYMRTCKNTCM